MLHNISRITIQSLIFYIVKISLRLYCGIYMMIPRVWPPTVGFLWHIHDDAQGMATNSGILMAYT